MACPKPGRVRSVSSCFPTAFSQDEAAIPPAPKSRAAKQKAKAKAEPKEKAAAKQKAKAKAEPKQKAAAKDTEKPAVAAKSSAESKKKKRQEETDEEDEVPMKRPAANRNDAAGPWGQVLHDPLTHDKDQAYVMYTKSFGFCSMLECRNRS